MGRAVKNAEKLKSEKLKSDARRTAADGLSRLPREVRERISLAIVDGATWKAVAKIAEAAGLPGVTAQNVTNYRHGAHKDWLARQERMDAIRRDSEATSEIVRHYAANGGSPAEAGLLAASEILTGALAGMGPEALQILMADDPKALFGITRELARVTQMLAARKTADASAPPKEDLKPDVSPEAREARMREIFGLPG